MSSNVGCSITVKNLKCNHMENPFGIETLQPVLSWKLTSAENGQHQTAYRILAASGTELLNEEKADLWDTGKVMSGDSVNVRYNGRKPVSRHKCCWKVKVWDKHGRESAWSGNAFFEMGLLSQKDWKARWICASVNSTDAGEAYPAPLLRKSFTISKKIASARAFICGLGYYELYVNGVKAGDDVLSPAVSQYDKTVLYNTYDITPALHIGENTFGAILGNGWYNCFTVDAWDFRQAPWRHHPKLIFQAHIEYSDGEEELIISDTSWKTAPGPITFDGLRNGEFYDARLEKQGWCETGYNCEGWENAKISKAPGGCLKSSQLPPIKVLGSITPAGLKEVRPGVWVYDLGRNISGWARIKVSGPAGTEVVLKYSEKIHEDGSIDTSNIDLYIESGEFQTDRYILKGTGTEIWEPRFTYHGFQYVEVSGYPGTPCIDDLYGRIVHTALPSAGSFSCSNGLLNSIRQCAVNSTLYNYHGIPTDCPHREKNGWTGDAVLSAEQTLMNFDAANAYAKWMKDFRDVQRPSGQLPGIVPTGGWGFNWGSGPAWDSALILIPWYIYLYYGDKAILEETYESMNRYMDFISSMAVNGIVDFGLGDWCPPEGSADSGKSPVAVTDTAYYYIDAVTISGIAEILENRADAEKYAELAESIKEAFCKEFVNNVTGLVKGNCQTSSACALYHNLVDGTEKTKVFELLAEQVEAANRHIDCGILGARYILHVLSREGRADLAYSIATQQDFPGWGYWIARGATTLWETWNGNSSLNHHMFSDISAWFYKSLAGINPDPGEPGFRHIIIKPNPVKGLEWVRASHYSPYGLITCNWEAKNGVLTLDLEIPVNCHATLYLPEKYSGEVIELGSGKYRKVIKSVH